MPRIDVHFLRNPRQPTAALWLCGLLVAGGPGMAGVAYGTDYSDGGVHTISGPDSDVTISNGTTVNVVPGAAVTGTSDDPAGHTAITVNDNASIVNVSGGSITGGDGSHAGGAGLFAVGGHFDISAGAFLGGSSSGVDVNHPGGDGAHLDFQSLTISGGSFTGGFGNEAGDGLQLDSATAKTAFISGGTYHGQGSTTSTNGFDLHVTGLVTANVSGGNFVGAHSGFADNAIGNLSGGNFDSITAAYNNAVLNVTAGQFAGGFDLHDSSVANVSGGELGFSALTDHAVMNLTGGHFSSIGPERFSVSQSAVLNIYGTGLTLEHLFGTLWDLQGTLADGTPIAVPTAVVIFDGGVVNLHQVPEPSTLVLAIVSFAGVVMAVWRRRSRWRSSV